MSRQAMMNPMFWLFFCDTLMLATTTVAKVSTTHAEEGRTTVAEDSSEDTTVNAAVGGGSVTTAATAGGSTASAPIPPTISVRVTVSMDNCSVVDNILSNPTDYKNASIHAMANQNFLFSADKTTVTLSKVNCARRLSAGLLRNLQSNIPGILSDFSITTPPGTTAEQANGVQSSPPTAASFQISLVAALAENSITANVAAVSPITAAVGNPTQPPSGGTPTQPPSGGTPAPSPPPGEAPEKGLSAGVIVGLVVGGLAGLCIVTLTCWAINKCRGSGGQGYSQSFHPGSNTWTFPTLFGRPAN